MRKILPILAVAALVLAGIALYAGVGRRPAPASGPEPSTSASGPSASGMAASSSSKSDAGKAGSAPAAATAESTTTAQTQAQTQPQTQAAASKEMPDTAPAGLLVTPEDIVMGNPNAPVTMIEYASLTCPHCAHFHNDVFPEIKKNYIDTGKVRFVYRDFPLDGLALRASMLAHCAGRDRFYGFLDLLFENQDSWAHVEHPMAAMERLAKLGGMDAAQFNKCVNDEELSKEVTKSRFDAEKVFDIESTPTFFINGEKVTGARPYEDFKAVLDRQLAGH